MSDQKTESKAKKKMPYLLYKKQTGFKKKGGGGVNFYIEIVLWFGKSK